MTIPVLAVLAVLAALTDGGGGWYGLRIAEATALRTGTVYPILARLEQAGWVTSSWEDDGRGGRNDPGARRKYYQLTPEGRNRALAALQLREQALAKFRSPS
jgi:DNA-binding PadR family transcriptional regulator